MKVLVDMARLPRDRLLITIIVWQRGEKIQTVCLKCMTWAVGRVQPVGDTGTRIPSEICHQHPQAVCMERESCLWNAWESWGMQINWQHDDREIYSWTCENNKALVHGKNCDSVHTGLTLFSLPQTQTAMEDGCVRCVHGTRVVFMERLGVFGGCR